MNGVNIIEVSRYCFLKELISNNDPHDKKEKKRKEKKNNLYFIYPPFMFSLLATVTVTTGTATDIYCLKSIEDFLEDL